MQRPIEERLSNPDPMNVGRFGLYDIREWVAWYTHESEKSELSPAVAEVFREEVSALRNEVDTLLGLL